MISATPFTNPDFLASRFCMISLKVPEAVATNPRNPQNGCQLLYLIYEPQSRHRQVDTSPSLARWKIHRSRRIITMRTSGSGISPLLLSSSSSRRMGQSCRGCIRRELETGGGHRVVGLRECWLRIVAAVAEARATSNLAFCSAIVVFVLSFISFLSLLICSPPLFINHVDLSHVSCNGFLQYLTTQPHLF